MGRSCSVSEAFMKAIQSMESTETLSEMLFDLNSLEDLEDWLNLNKN